MKLQTRHSSASSKVMLLQITFAMKSTSSYAFVPAFNPNLSLLPRKSSYAFGNIGHNGLQNPKTSFSLTTKLNNDDDDEFEDNKGETIFYDDFEDFMVGGESIGETIPQPEEEVSEILSQKEFEKETALEPVSPQLKDMLQQSLKEEELRQQRISRNWSQGNWKCRGFSLDKVNPLELADDTANVDNKPNAMNRGWVVAGTMNNTATTEDSESASLFNNKAVGGSSNEVRAMEKEDSPPIHVCQIAFDETSIDEGFGETTEIMAVGRTDGKVFMIQLGSEYLTKFTAVPKLSWGASPDKSSDGENDKLRIETEMLRDNELKERFASELSGIHDIETLDIDSSLVPAAKTTPFEIMCEFQAHSANDAISALVLHDDILYTGGASGMVHMWKMDEVQSRTCSTETLQMIPAQNLNVHQDKIVALKTLSSRCFETGSSVDVSDHDLLLSASCDGSFALWDKDGDMVYRCQMVEEDGGSASITSADVDVSGNEHIIYLGLSSGHVVGYVVSELIERASDGDSSPVPKCRFLAHDPLHQKNKCEARGITALSCGGPGSMTSGGGGSSSSSTVILTGGADGMIKQWEVIKQNERSSVSTEEANAGNDEAEVESKSSWKLQHWPLLPNQRMKGRAHIFQGHNNSPITALVSGEDGAPKILSAGADGSLRVWDASKGEMYRMDGFETVSSICLDREILVTDGMGEYVCVHDFDVTDEDVGGEFDLDLDW